MKKCYIISAFVLWALCLILSVISIFAGDCVRIILSGALLLLGASLFILIYSHIKAYKTLEEDELFVRRDMALQRLIRSDSAPSHVEFNRQWASSGQRDSGVMAMFPGDGFCVITFTADDYDKAALDPLYSLGVIKYPDMDCDDIICTLIRHELPELLENEGLCAQCTTIDWELFCVVNFDFSPDKNAETLYSISRCCRRLMEKLESEFNVVLSCFVSSIGRGIDSVTELYDEVMQISEYRKMLSLNDRLLLFSELSIDGPNSGSSGLSIYSVPDGSQALERHRIFINCMAAHDYTAAKNVISNIIKAEFTDSSPVIEFAPYRLHSIIDMLISAFDCVKADISQELYSQLFPLYSLTDVQTAGELSEKVDHIFDILIEHSENSPAQPVPDWVGKMKEYISSQYVNPDLNVNLVAMHFGLNPAYTSRSFKLYTGTGLLDYIHSIRIKRAKELLAAGSTVKDAAEKSGFSNTRSMNRAFLKYEGVNPGKVARAASGKKEKMSPEAQKSD